MKYAKIENDVIIQIQPNLEKGFVEVPDDAVCGQIKQGNSFANPNPYVPSPIEVWEKEMEISDKLLPRYIEDVIDILSPEQLSALAPETKLKYDEKKSKRAAKPEE